MCIFDSGRVELPKVNAEAQAAVLFLEHNNWGAPRAVGGADDAVDQHLLDQGYFFSPDSGVLTAIWLAEVWSLGFDGVLQQRGEAKIILPLADNIAEFLEDVLQLLLLDGRQVLRDRRQAKRFGDGWQRWEIGDGDNL